MFKKVGNNKEKLKAGVIDDELFNQSLQLYYGMLKHCKGYKLKLKIIFFLLFGCHLDII